jgi:hypothetical protein
MKKNKIITLSFCATLGLALFTLNAAGAEEKHDEHAEKSEMKIPDTADGILAEIHKHHSELADVVTNKKLADVHHHAFAVRDLAKALVDKAPADKKQRVQGAANNIAKLADELDKAGDAGDQAKTEANLKKFDAVIAQLEAQFKS